MCLKNIQKDTSFWVEAHSIGSTNDTINTTLFGFNQSYGGMMFEVVPDTNLIVKDFITRLGGFGLENVRIYYKKGGFIGHEKDSSQWTSLGARNVLSLDSSLGIRLNLSLQVPLKKDSVYSFYISSNTWYTAGKYKFSNSHLSINSGSSMSGHFGNPKSSSTFNGSIIYGFEQLSCKSRRVKASTVVIPTSNITLGNDTFYCANARDTFTLHTPSGFESYRWNTGDTLHSIKVDTAGNYMVMVTDSNQCQLQSEITISEIAAPTSELRSDTSVCANEHVNVALDAGSGYSYKWSTGDTIQKITALKHGKIYLKLTGQYGCTTNDSVAIIELAVPNPDLGPDSIICSEKEFPIILNPGSGFRSYSWNDSSSNRTLTAKKGGSYSVTVENGMGCFNKDTVVLTKRSSPVFNLGPDISYCSDNGIEHVLFPNKFFRTYRWNDQSTDSFLLIKKAGTYWLEASNEYNCKARDSIQVFELPSPRVYLGNDTTYCASDEISLQLDAGSGFKTYTWENGWGFRNRTIESAGVYFVIVENFSGCKGIDSLVVKELPGPQVDLGKDILANPDLPLSVELDAGAGHKSYKWQDGSASQKITVTKSGTYHVTVTDSLNCTSSDTINVSFWDPLSVEQIQKDGLKVYPNPANRQITIWSANGLQSLNVIDARGVMVYEATNVTNKITLQTDSWSEGLYFIITYHQGIRSNAQIVIRH